MWATWLHGHLVNLKHKHISAFWVFHKIRPMQLISIAKTIQQCTALYIISPFLTTAIIKNNKALHLWLSLSVIKKQSYQLLPQCAFKPTAINGSTVQFTHTERANWQIPTTLQRRKRAKPMATKIKHDKTVKAKLEWEKETEKLGWKVSIRNKMLFLMCSERVMALVWYQSSKRQGELRPATQTEKPGWREDTLFHNNHRGSQPCHYPGQQSRGTPEPRRQSMRCQAFVCLRRLLQWQKR